MSKRENNIPELTSVQIGCFAHLASAGEEVLLGSSEASATSAASPTSAASSAASGFGFWYWAPLGCEPHLQAPVESAAHAVASVSAREPPRALNALIHLMPLTVRPCFGRLGRTCYLYRLHRQQEPSRSDSCRWRPRSECFRPPKAASGLLCTLDR